MNNKKYIYDGDDSIGWQNKKQHYVPRVYGDRFCECPKHVNVYDKLKDEIRTNQNYENVASERSFYDVDLNAYNRELKVRGEPTLDELFPGFEEIDPQFNSNHRYLG